MSFGDKTLAFLVIMAIGTTAKAFVLVYMWAWFLTPFGLSEIGMAHAYGLSLTITYLTSNTSADSQIELDADYFIKKGASAFLTPAVFLVAGWITQRLM